MADFEKGTLSKVSLSSDGRLVLQVADNGRGISREELLGSKSLGLTGMRERISLLGGKLDQSYSTLFSMI